MPAIAQHAIVILFSERNTLIGILNLNTSKMRSDQPVLSVDTKKEMFVGNFKKNDIELHTQLRFRNKGPQYSG